MASGLSARLRRLEGCIALLSEMSGRLEYLQPTIGSLINSLAAQERFADLVFLRECADSMRAGDEFSRSWRVALEKQAGGLGREEADILGTLGDVLGRSDLESQLAALSLTREQLSTQIAGTRDKIKARGGLYRSIGVLGGVAAAIILI